MKVLSAGRSRLRILLNLILGLGLTAFSGQILWAQVSITSDDGGNSTAGNLYAADLSINATPGGGILTLAIPAIDSDLVTLNQVLPSFSQSVTFQETVGTDTRIGLVGQNELESAFTFQQNLTLGNGVTFNLFNNGLGGVGQMDCSVTVLNLSLGVSVVSGVHGGLLNNDDTNIASGGSGGNASLSAGTLTIGSGDTLTLVGGEMANNNFGTVNGNAAGGNASLGAASLNMSGNSNLSVTGGEADNTIGSVYFNSVTSGSASVSVGTLTLSGLFDVISVTGGLSTNNNGSYIYGDESSGSASISAGTLSLLGQGDSLIVAGGLLDNTADTGYVASNGIAGNASLTATALSMGAGTTLTVTGGEVNNSLGGWIWGSGTSGSASVSAGTLSLGSGDVLALTGGELDNLNGTISSGGTAGNAFLSASSLSAAADTTISVTGGLGISGLGGSASVSAGTLSLGSGDVLALTGGELDNGTGILSSSLTAGNASLTASSLSMAAGTTVSVTGGQGIGLLNGSGSVSLGSLTGSGTVTIGGNTASLQVNSGNFAGMIEGSECLDKLSSGTLTLTGSNTYSGGTSIAGGILNIQNDGNLGAEGTTLTLDGGDLQTSGSVLSNRNLVITSNNGTIDTNGNNSSLSGIISGSGNLTVDSSTGSGALTLTAANIYSGGTAINTGMLVAANSNALGSGSVTVNGGTLALSGPVTLNIAGNYTQGSSGTLQLGLGLLPGQHDTLNIAGTADLAGTLSLVPYSDFVIHKADIFEILSAGSVSGTFNTLSNGTADDSVSLIYEPSEILLEITGPTFAALGMTPNQKNIGADLDYLNSQSGNSNLIDYLNTLPNASLPGVYDQLSPSSLTSLFKMDFAASQAQSGMIGRRLSQIFGDTRYSDNDTAWNGQGPMFAGVMPAQEEAQTAQSVQRDRWGVFANATGDWGTVASDANGAGYQFLTDETTAGLDYRLNKDLVIGLMLGDDHSNTSQSTGTVNTNGGQAGLYAGWKADQLHVEALVDGGLDTYTTQRAGLGGTALGNTAGTEYTGQLNAGYDMKMDDFLLSPFVSGQWTQVNVNGFVETGSMAPLTYGNQSEAYLSSDLGAQLSLNLKIGGIKLLPNVNGAWEHVYEGNIDSLTANFGSGDNFTVSGSATGTDAAVLGAGLKTEFEKGLNLYIEYQGTLGMTNYTEQAISGGANIGF